MLESNEYQKCNYPRKSTYKKPCKKFLSFLACHTAWISHYVLILYVPKKNTLICLQDRPWHFQTLIKSLQRLSGRQISNKNSHKFILFFFPFLLCHAILDEDNLNTLLAWTIFFNMWYVKCKRLEWILSLPVFFSLQRLFPPCYLVLVHPVFQCTVDGTNRT